MLPKTNFFLVYEGVGGGCSHDINFGYRHFILSFFSLVGRRHRSFKFPCQTIVHHGSWQEQEALKRQERIQKEDVSRNIVFDQKVVFSFFLIILVIFNFTK